MNILTMCTMLCAMGICSATVSASSPRSITDFNGDGFSDSIDLSLLIDAVEEGNPADIPTFDVDGNNVLNTADVAAWIMLVNGT